ncbi:MULTISPECIES: MFS transporter [Sutcliffiella]|uniref:MFS transporter n=1 Tax=Sutcliffiella cohnii TaxID=33932 RepID=A0A223KUY7_9BACI|nr:MULTISPECIES: MFS transporter [Sutcliffiella]AST93167.1 MFS transporter [Sutcliffiella cohnii]WBL14370.1 MFS transporter [Sutcliffiella sp. NC1]
MKGLYNKALQPFVHYNKNIRLFFIANIFIQIGLGIFMVMYNFYIRELGFAEQVNGSMIAMSSLAAAIILIPAGLLSDKFGRKKMMVTGVILTSSFMLLRSTFEAEGLLLLTAFLFGLTLAFLQVSAVPWLAENSSQAERVRLFSLHFAVMTGSNVIGNLLGGTLTDVFLHLFQLSPVWSVRGTLIIGTVFCLLGLLPIVKMMEKKREIKKEKTSLLQSFRLNKTQLKLIGFFAFAQLLIGFGSGLVIPYLNLYFADRFETSNTSIGFILSLGQAVTAVAMIIGPALVKRVGEVKAIVLLQLLSIPFMLLTAFTYSFWFAALGFLFRQALMNAANPIITSLMMEKVADSMKGLANSINQMVFNIGWASMGPVSMGIVFYLGSYWGYAVVFCITACLYICSSIFFYIVFTRNSKKVVHQQVANIS